MPAHSSPAALQVVLSLDELNQLPGKGRFGTFLHNITKFYYTYHQCVLHAVVCRCCESTSSHIASSVQHIADLTRDANRQE